jgi:hypothetical protein
VLLDVVTTRGAPHRAWYAAAGALVWITVTISIISFFDWHYLPAALMDTPEGFLVLNWYVLLMLMLLVLLPIRAGRTLTVAGSRRVTGASPPGARAGRAASPG